MASHFVRNRRKRRVCQALTFFVCIHLLVCTRVPPRTLRETRRRLVNWQSVLREAMSRPKFDCLQTNSAVYLISIPANSDRRRQTVVSLRRESVEYTVFPAFDGLEKMNSSDLQHYAGKKTQQALLATAGLSRVELQRWLSLYKSGNLPHRRQRLLHARLRFACFVSHVRVWQELLRTNLDYVIILEDDALVVPNFGARLRSLLNQLPVDWDLLHLGGCEQKYGPEFAQNLRLSRGGLCTFGYILANRAAREFLSSQSTVTDKPIDHFIDQAIYSRRILAFHAVPALVTTTGSPSTLAY